MKIHVTLTHSELAESDLSASELQAVIVAGLDDVSPALPGFNVSICMSAHEMENSLLEQTTAALQLNELEPTPAKHRLLHDFDYQGISIRFITPTNGSVYLEREVISDAASTSRRTANFTVRAHQKSKRFNPELTSKPRYGSVPGVGVVPRQLRGNDEYCCTVDLIVGRHPADCVAVFHSDR